MSASFRRSTVPNPMPPVAAFLGAPRIVGALAHKQPESSATVPGNASGRPSAGTRPPTPPPCAPGSRASPVRRYATDTPSRQSGEQRHDEGVAIATLNSTRTSALTLASPTARSRPDIALQLRRLVCMLSRYYPGLSRSIDKMCPPKAIVLVLLGKSVSVKSIQGIASREEVLMSQTERLPPLWYKAAV